MSFETAPNHGAVTRVARTSATGLHSRRFTCGGPSSGKPVPRKADTLNADLAKAGKYSKLDQKQITASLDLRNKTAQKKNSQYSAQQDPLMLADGPGFSLSLSPPPPPPPSPPPPP